MAKGSDYSDTIDPNTMVLHDEAITGAGYGVLNESSSLRLWWTHCVPSVSTATAAGKSPATSANIKKVKTVKTKAAKAPVMVTVKPTEPRSKGRSIWHSLFEEQKLVFNSLDLETGGENCGIIQLLAEVVCLEINRFKSKAAKASLTGVVRVRGVYRNREDTAGTIFSKYINSGKDA